MIEPFLTVSAGEEGSSSVWTIVCTVRFEAAHFLPHVPTTHKCRRLHGHSFVVDLYVQGPLDEEKGWVMDFSAVKAAFVPLHERLDHRLLNDIAGLENPTSERLAQYIYRELHVLGLTGLIAVRVQETCTSACWYQERSVLSD
jgi:6-pyruvoyltetrahydropterin/6-carboxytetrahydropterin synthase